MILLFFQPPRRATLDESAGLPLGTTAAASVLIAADSAQPLPLATAATIGVVLAADSTRALPLGESATITAIDAIADSEALPLGTTAVAQTLVALAASKALPLSTLAAASLPVAFDQTGVVPLATSAVGSTVVALDSMGSLPLGQVVDMSLGAAPSSTLDSSKGLPLRTFAEFQSAAREEEGITLGRRPIKRREITLDSRRTLPLRTVLSLVTVPVEVTKTAALAIAPARITPRTVEPAPPVIAPPPVTAPVPVRKPQPIRRRIVSQLTSESRLPLGTRASASVIPFPVATPRPKSAERPVRTSLPLLEFEGSGALPLRTSATISLAPIAPPEQAEDDDIDVILVAYDMMQAA